jgi:hypothetical protein
MIPANPLATSPVPEYTACLVETAGLLGAVSLRNSDAIDSGRYNEIKLEDASGRPQSGKLMD